MDNTQMESGHRKLERAAAKIFLRLETGAYLAIGVAFALVAVIGIAKAVQSIWDAVIQFESAEALVLSIDRLLLVLMVVEILHTVRSSFRSGSLVCEPFLVVGLIASIRRMLVITLESSQQTQSDKWTPAAKSLFDSTMIELGVLAVLVLVMVTSIYVLRKSGQITKETDESEDEEDGDEQNTDKQKAPGQSGHG